MLTLGSLFAGIGGIELGLERTGGFRTVWQVENDPFACRVLAKHWPSVRRHDDVRTFPPGPADDWRCDLVCGGFPCQDISRAGRKAGIGGPSSGLWGDFATAVGVLRPRFVLVENTPSLLVRGMSVVLGDLAALGYDAEWDCLPAASFGAPHIRDRLFLLAYRRDAFWNPAVHDSLRGRYRAPEKTVFAGRGSLELSSWWAREPGVARMVHGLPRGLDRSRRDRVRALGNAVVPQVAEHIGRRILDSLKGRIERC